MPSSSMDTTAYYPIQLVNMGPVIPFQTAAIQESDTTTEPRPKPLYILPKMTNTTSNETAVTFKRTLSNRVRRRRKLRTTRSRMRLFSLGPSQFGIRNNHGNQSHHIGQRIEHGTETSQQYCGQQPMVFIGNRTNSRTERVDETSANFSSIEKQCSSSLFTGTTTYTNRSPPSYELSQQKTVKSFDNNHQLTKYI